MMLYLDRLRIKLPAGFEQRAPGIVQLFPRHLVNFEFPAGVNLSSLTLRPIAIEPSASNPEVAGKIAQEFAFTLGQIAGSPPSKRQGQNR